jgi:hypothetical protein
MKPLIKPLMLMVVCCCIFYGCSKQSRIPDNINIQKVREVMQMNKPGDEAVVAFNMLTNEEKAFAWQQHIKEATASLALNDEQQQLINRCMQTISAAIYDPLTKDGYKGILAEINYLARKLFSKQEYGDIFLNLQSAAVIAPSVTEPSGNTCWCKYDIYCETRLKTDNTECYKKANCTETITGCGLFSDSPCTGICLFVNRAY